MKTQYLLSLVSASLLAVSVYAETETLSPHSTTSSADGSEVAAASAYALSPDGKSVPYSSNVWGMNNNYLFLPFSPESPVYAEYAGPLDLRVLRFPGGSSSNAYRWEDGSYDNWFHKKRIMPALKNFPPSRQENVAANSGILTIEDCVAVNDALATEPIVVFNVLREPEESRAMAQALYEAGIDLQYAELGNELYYSGYEKWTGAPEVFALKMRAHAEAIREVFPDVCIAVPVGGNHHGYASVAGMIDEQADEKTRLNLERAAQWNAALAADPFFDAIVVHHYLGYRIPGNELGNIEASQEANGDGIYNALFFEAEDSPRWLTERFTSQFPGKKILMTEWGVLHKVEPWFQNWAHALSSAEFMLNLAAEGEVWDVSCYHILTGRRFELFAPEYDVNRQWTGEITRSLPYFTLEMVGRELAVHANIRKFTAPNFPEAGTQAYHYAPVSAWLLDGGEEGPVLLAINLSDQNVDLDLSPAGLVWKGGEAETLSCPSLASNRGAAHRPDDTSTSENFPLRQISSLAGPHFTLPPYSLTRLNLTSIEQH